MPELTSLLDTPGMDTWLARLLNERGRVELATLQELLAVARAGRAGGQTLARTLVDRGLLDAGEVNDLLARTVTRVGATESDVQPCAWAPGTRVDDYLIQEPLGAGGMGAVYSVEDTRTGGEFALKALSIGAEPELVLRFQREAEAQARVGQHANVVSIHATGVAAGRAYLVMDLARGGDLAARLEGGPLPVRTAAELVRDLALGLAHVHGQGVLHRDIKPANILYDERGTPKLVDFGLARLAGADTLTQSGALLGTPTHMAPEQAMGHNDRIDARTDVYGLGAVLYEALIGEPPFRGASVMQILLRVVNDPPAPPRSLREDVPAELEAICLRALEKEPDQRQPSALALAQELDAFLAGRPVPHRRKARPMAFLIPLATFALGVLLALGGVSLRSSPPGKSEVPAVSVRTDVVEEPLEQVPPRKPTKPRPLGTMLARLEAEAEQGREQRAESARNSLRLARKASDPEIAVRWLMRACALDIRAVVFAKPAAETLELLVKSAETILSSAVVSPAQLDVARRRLVEYRLLQPAKPIDPQVLSSLWLAAQRSARHRRAGLPVLERFALSPNELQALLITPIQKRAESGRVWPKAWSRAIAIVWQVNYRSRTRLLETCLLWQPRISTLWVAFGEALGFVGEHQRALHALSIAHAYELRSGLVAYRTGWVLWLQGRPKPAIPILQEALARLKGRSRRLYAHYCRKALAECLLLDGKPREAVKVLEASPAHRQKLERRVEYWALRARCAKALAALEPEQKEQHEKQAAAYYRRAREQKK